MSSPFLLIPISGSGLASLDEAWQEAKQDLTTLIIEEMDMGTWVCAECGADIVYPGAVCIEDEYHKGQIRREDWERKERRKEVAQQDIKDLFGPKDMR